tara:strand:- start:1 stop:291 length:291 start_codon:yes stop_codon:yes gene_type:complete
MARQFREFELMCLTDLVPHLSFEKEWIPLYASWLRREHDEHTDLLLVNVWAKHVLKGPDFLDARSVLYRNTEHFPNTLQSELVYAIRHRSLMQMIV